MLGLAACLGIYKEKGREIEECDCKLRMHMRWREYLHLHLHLHVSHEIARISKTLLCLLPRLLLLLPVLLFS